MDTQARSAFFSSLLMLSIATFSFSSIANADQLLNKEINSWKLMSDRLLSEARGGFIFSNGVEMDIGLQRNLSVSGLGTDPVDNLLQNTTGTSINIPISSSNTIIRNSLDNMNLKNTTIINVRLKNFNLFKNPTILTPQFQTRVEPAVYQ